MARAAAAGAAARRFGRWLRSDSVLATTLTEYVPMVVGSMLAARGIGELDRKYGPWGRHGRTYFSRPARRGGGL